MERNCRELLVKTRKVNLWATLSSRGIRSIKISMIQSNIWQVSKDNKIGTWMLLGTLYKLSHLGFMKTLVGRFIIHFTNEEINRSLIPVRQSRHLSRNPALGAMALISMRASLSVRSTGVSSYSTEIHFLYLSLFWMHFWVE